MLNQKDKVERFAAVINRTAAEQCRFIEKQTKHLEEKQLREVELQSRAELEASVNNELKSIREEISREISEMKAESRKKRIAHREMITEKVFLMAENKIKIFTESEAYSSFLDASIIKISDILSPPFTLYARHEDVELVKQLISKKDITINVCVDDGISLGGIYGVSADKTVRADDTLDSRLEAETDTFRENSKLSINL